MKNKLEKLEELNYCEGRDAFTLAMCNTIVKKQNEIIDYLNTQSQEGVQDTSEEWEDRLWGVKIDNDLLPEWTLKDWIGVDIRRIITENIKQLLLERERKVLESMKDWVVEYYKDSWNIRDFDAEKAIGKIIDRELNKLNKKTISNMGKWKQELEEILKEETDMGKDMIPKYARCYARIILENFISQELLKAREEVLREVLDKSRDLSMLHLNPHIRTSDVEEMLSKLTTK